MHAHTRTDEARTHNIRFAREKEQEKRRKKEDIDSTRREIISARGKRIRRFSSTWCVDREIFIRRKMKTHRRHPHNLSFAVGENSRRSVKMDRISRWIELENRRKWTVTRRKPEAIQQATETLAAWSEPAVRVMTSLVNRVGVDTADDLTFAASTIRLQPTSRRRRSFNRLEVASVSCVIASVNHRTWRNRSPKR